MNGRTNSQTSRKKWIVGVLGVLILIGAWWLFRPEKLWVNKKVDEPAPFAANADPDPIYTGLLSGRAHPTSGRASIYQTPEGNRELRLTNFTTSNGPDVHIVLAQSADESLKRDFVKGNLSGVELGPMKANEGDQNYDLPSSADLERYDTVVVYCVRFHVIFATAKLEKF